MNIMTVLDDETLLDRFHAAALERCYNDEEAGERMLKLDACRAECVRRNLDWSR